MLKRSLLLGLPVLVFGCSSAPKNPWAEVRVPTRFAASESIGEYSKGCLIGAQSLPPDGVGYSMMRLTRRRFYGHPSMIEFIENFGRQMHKAKLGTLLISDIGQPRGGPMPPGAHASHQMGLDVDIWLRQNTDPKKTFTLDERENEESPSLVAADKKSINRANWNDRIPKILALAAKNEKVERIFVHGVIKKQLCVTLKEAKRKKTNNDTSWLQKLRPWWGHDAHFHVRLKCPPESKNCKPQDPVDPGDGCDATLDWWMSDEALKEAAEKDAKPPSTKLPELPAECEPVLKM